MRHVVSGTLQANSNNSYLNLQNLPNLQVFVGGWCHWHWKKTGVSENMFAFLMQISKNPLFLAKKKKKKPWKDRQGCVKTAWAQGLQLFQGPFKRMQHQRLTFPQTSASCKLSAIMHQKSLKTLCVRFIAVKAPIIKIISTHREASKTYDFIFFQCFLGWNRKEPTPTCTSVGSFD